MVLAGLGAVMELLHRGLPYVTYLRYGFILYFLAQGVLSSMDYWRYGFTNGAADNASGTAVAISVAHRLWQDTLPGWRVELVLTSAEEVNLKGSLAYFKTNSPWDPARTYVLNFDNVGAGHLKVITATGSLTSTKYDNALVQAALQVAARDSRFAHVTSAEWHTGDFDSLWFARTGIPSLTISAQDEQGQIPHLHRPTDTLGNVDPAVVRLAADFGEAVARAALGPQSPATEQA
jgi:Zn-dependent M28 family amino/carboxypeptidase